MTDKMREEFEAAVLSEYPNQNMGKFATGEYQSTTIEHCWWAWQKSREALVITLPNTECFGEYSQEAARVMRDSCADAIEDQGIKFEVSE